MKTQTLKVPGATIYYETRGSGPVLLMIAGGGTDAGVFEAIAPILAEDYTVVTYDPRGNSRSPLDNTPEDQSIAIHSDDASRLLEAVTPEPAIVFGTSSGAIVGLDLIARHPERVAKLIAHEPPLLEILPDSATWHAVNEHVYEIYQREGAGAAMNAWAVGVGLEGTMQPPAVPLPPEVAATMARMAGNMDLFFGHELLPFTHYRPNLTLLSAHKERIVLAGGLETRDHLAGKFAYRPAALLAEHLDTQVVEFPGDHGGYGAHAVTFAAKLHEILK
ncbi:alpha/beta fold hydrolase [Tengunoibacter tsumagoiensis]|uniref:Putative hydrolase YraK n=1 Tax=Tengunoibacter tsumagoiensis TaxID=2014871 RepID=A0A401ZZE8_9CHLR|nr:alpha/beta hydrolase [Tengunoibacter tsumagoiensis]GCE12182.1 putative hydrolase YraK [Tengunoibacter tsumagoiensis]